MKEEEGDDEDRLERMERRRSYHNGKIPFVWLS
jgi:hypothetical protein